MSRKVRNIIFILVALSIATLLWYSIQHRQTPEQVFADQKAQVDLDQKAFTLYSQLTDGDVVIPHSSPDSTNYDCIWVVYINRPGERTICVKMRPDNHAQCLNYSDAYQQFHALKVIKFGSPEWSEAVRSHLY